MGNLGSRSARILFTLACLSLLAPSVARRNQRLRVAWAVLLLPLLTAASCRTYVVNVTVVNHTGGVVNLLEVDYPSASFGVDTMPAGGVFHYHLQVQDSGSVKVMYTEGRTQRYKSTGPNLYQGQQGQLEIVLNPNGKTEFHPRLTPPN